MCRSTSNRMHENYRTSARNIGLEANVEAQGRAGFCSIAHMGAHCWARLPVLIPFAVRVGRRSTSGGQIARRALLIACLVVASSLIALPASAAGAIQFRKIQYDTPGADKPVSNTKLNAEYVTIKNTGTTTRTFIGWTVLDPAHHVYIFPSFKLGAGESVRLDTVRAPIQPITLLVSVGTSGTTPATKRSCAAAAARSKTPALGEMAAASSTARSHIELLRGLGRRAVSAGESPGRARVSRGCRG
jgi:hypothetical protein